MSKNKVGLVGVMYAKKHSEIIQAAKNGDVDALRERLNDFVKPDLRATIVNLPGHDGDTALHMAARGGHLECVKLLLDSGADITISNNVKSTALHCASSHVEGSIVVEELLKRGANPNVQNNYGNTALHCVISTLSTLHFAQLSSKDGYKEEVFNGKNRHEGEIGFADKQRKSHIILEKLPGILAPLTDLSCKNKCGNTVLHHAAELGEYDVLSTLMKNLSTNRDTPQYTGFILIKNESGKSVLDILRGPEHSYRKDSERRQKECSHVEKLEGRVKEISRKNYIMLSTTRKGETDDRPSLPKDLGRLIVQWTDIAERQQARGFNYSF